MTGEHAQPRTLHEVLWYPAHDERTTSPEFRKVRHHLIDVLDEPCWVCGARKSTGATMHAHHAVLEWALANAADPAKILATFPAMGAADDEHLREWLDSEGNMLILCDVHHLHGLYGIHMVTYPAWVAQRYLKSGWDLAKGPTDDAGL